MPFRVRKNCGSVYFFEPSVTERKVLPSGEVAFVSSKSHLEYDYDSMKLKPILDAGIPLDSVSTQVLGSSSIDLPFGSLESEGDTEKTNNDVLPNDDSSDKEQ